MITPKRKALTIWQPWSWLIAHGLKDIENRDWSTSYRGLLLIHAGATIDPDAFFTSGELNKAYFYRAGASLEVVAKMPQRKEEYETRGIIGIVDLVGVINSSIPRRNPWFHGRYGFVLNHAQPIPRIPLPGRQMLFDVPDEIVAQVMAHIDSRLKVPEV